MIYHWCVLIMSSVYWIPLLFFFCIHLVMIVTFILNWTDTGLLCFKGLWLVWFCISSSGLLCPVDQPYSSYLLEFAYFVGFSVWSSLLAHLPAYLWEILYQSFRLVTWCTRISAHEANQSVWVTMTKNQSADCTWERRITMLAGQPVATGYILSLEKNRMCVLSEAQSKSGMELMDWLNRLKGAYQLWLPGKACAHQTWCDMSDVATLGRAAASFTTGQWVRKGISHELEFFPWSETTGNVFIACLFCRKEVPLPNFCHACFAG